MLFAAAPKQAFVGKDYPSPTTCSFFINSNTSKNISFSVFKLKNKPLLGRGTQSVSISPTVIILTSP